MITWLYTIVSGRVKDMYIRCNYLLHVSVDKHMGVGDIRVQLVGDTRVQLVGGIRVQLVGDTGKQLVGGIRVRLVGKSK